MQIFLQIVIYKVHQYSKFLRRHPFVVLHNIPSSAHIIMNVFLGLVLVIIICSDFPHMHGIFYPDITVFFAVNKNISISEISFHLKF